MEEFLEGLRNFVCDEPDPSEFIGVPHNRTGIKHTDETKELCRQANIGRRHTKETCKKMSKTRIGHSVSEETRNKIANTLCKGPYLMKHISGEEILVYNLVTGVGRSAMLTCLTPMSFCFTMRLFLYK